MKANNNTMKTIKKIASAALMLMVLTMVSACSKIADFTDIDRYVETNSAPEVIEELEAMDMYQSFECYRDGYNIVAEYTFSPDVNLEGMTDDDINDSRAETINPIVNDYRANDFVARAVEAMAENNGNFIYVYKDNYGHSLSMSVPAEVVASMAK